MTPGGMIEKPAPIAVSNVMLVCPTCNRPTRVGVTRQGAQGRDGPRPRLQARLRRGDRQADGRPTTETYVAAPEGALRRRDPRRALKDELELDSIMQVPKVDEDHAEHGRRRREDRRQGARHRDRGADDDRRPARADAPGPQVDRELQAPRGDGRRRARDAARRPDVRVPRPARLDRAAAHPRLPRASTRTRSTAAATTRSASASRSSSRRSTTTASQSIRGLDVAITTTAETDEQARALLRGLGLPFAAESRRDSEHGQEVPDRVKQKRDAEVQDAGVHALQPVRPAARRLQEVRALPDLPARARAPGRDPRHDQELAGRRPNDRC